MSQAGAGFARLFKARIFGNLSRTRTAIVYKIEIRNGRGTANEKGPGLRDEESRPTSYVRGISAAKLFGVTA